MALNPNTVKALFGTLVPLADDAAGAIAKYGDDVADDLRRLSTYFSKANLNTLTPPLPVKNALQAPTLTMSIHGVEPYGGPEGVLAKLHDTLSGLPTSSAYDRHTANSAFTDAVQSAGTRGNTVPIPTYTTRLGNLEPHRFEGVGGGDGIEWYEFANDSVKLPKELPTSGMVVDAQHSVRPHKNTKLGDWYGDQHANIVSLLSMEPPDTSYLTDADLGQAEQWAYDAAMSKLNRNNFLDDILMREGELPGEDIGEYLESLYSTSRKSPFRPNDPRLLSLQEQLQKRYNLVSSLQEKIKTPIKRPWSLDEVSSDLSQVETLLKLLESPEQLSFDI